jgi:DNA-binding CsgD family transcriptional regulator
MGHAVRARKSSKTSRTISAARERAIVGSIYDAALQPGEWSCALAALSDYARTREAFIALIDVRTGSFPLLEGVHFAQEVFTDFLARWANPERNLWMRAGITVAPVGPCLNMDRMVPRSQLERTDHFRELLVPWHTERCAGAVLFQLPGMVAAYTTYRSARDPDLDRHDEAVLDRFMPHLGRALEIHRRLSGVATTGRQYLEALHRLERGVVLLDGEGGVLFSNHSATEILRSADGLTAAGGRLAASAPDDHAKLARLVGEVTRTGQRQGQAAGGTLLLRRPSGKRPLSLLLAPLGDNPFCFGMRIPVAAAFLSDPERQRAGPLQALAQRYSFTPREAAVAGLVASGIALPGVADALKISVSTARTHLYRVFEKAGIRRQAELVKLLLTEPAGVASGLVS